MKQIVKTGEAPLPIGPYNQAVKANGVLYISGQIAINPADGSLVNDSLEAETHQVLKNLGAILRAEGLDYEQVVKCTVFIKDMHQFSRINAVYGEYFPEATAPARETVEVSNLPRFMQVEISAIAVY
ncbi:MAG TPA: Rid family detoxifying hydrolase [Saprospiraceae bacterium]|nr:Rid family detoxifying hydrolase [Saprospiraceae bacterium]HNT20343.1 Rid family detoxifying hydrolase [Saprospiraceae bacterium]